MKLDLDKIIVPPPGIEGAKDETMAEVLGQRLLMLTSNQVNEYFMGEVMKVYRWGTELSKDGVTDIDPDDLEKIENYLNKGDHGIFAFAYAQMLEAIKEAKSGEV